MSPLTKFKPCTVSAVVTPAPVGLGVNCEITGNGRIGKPMLFEVVLELTFCTAMVAVPTTVNRLAGTVTMSEVAVTDDGSGVRFVTPEAPGAVNNTRASLLKFVPVIVTKVSGEPTIAPFGFALMMLGVSGVPTVNGSEFEPVPVPFWMVTGNTPSVATLAAESVAWACVALSTVVVSD